MVITTIANINAFLVKIRSENASLISRMQKSGFSSEGLLGIEQEYTVSGLCHFIDSLVIQFLTITSNRNQFIQRTSYAERKQIEKLFQKLLVCIEQTHQQLDELKQNEYDIDESEALAFEMGGRTQRLMLALAVDVIDQLKPSIRMLELVTAQQRIHALSAVLETLLHKEPAMLNLQSDEDYELTDEQQRALELSHYLIKQAL